MLKTARVEQIQSDVPLVPLVYAFRINGGVSIDEMAEVGDVMDSAFDSGELSTCS
jgi:hypothetical protein